MALNTSKPGIIGEIDRAAAAELGLVALFLFQESSGYIRDVVTKAGAALTSGGVAIDQPGLVLTFNGSQAQNLAFPTLPNSTYAPYVIAARIKATAVQTGDPGQFFGVCASSGTQASFGVGFDNSSPPKVGGTWLDNNGAGVTATSQGALNTWYTVYAQPTIDSTGTVLTGGKAWINGVAATTA